MITKEQLLELEAKCLEIALAKSKEDKKDYDCISFCDGELSVQFSSTWHGELEEDWIDISLEDLDKDVEILRAEYQAKKLEEEKIRAEKVKTEKEAQRLQKEKDEYERYLSLKQKFENK